MDVRSSLRRLVSGYFVSANRVTSEYELHPLDRDNAYRSLLDDGEPDVFNRRNLEIRAADFYASVRKPEDEWQTIGDLEPQLNEFEHRVRAGDYDGAFKVLEPIDYDYLFLWGHYTRLTEMREELQGRLTDRGLQADNLGGLGEIHRAKGHFEQAIECFEEALEISCKIDDRRRVGLRRGNLGFTYYSLGDYEWALEHSKEALEIARETNDGLRIGIWLGNLGLIYQARGQIQQALECLEEALAVTRTIGDRRFEGIWLGKLGFAYQVLGQIEHAIECFKNALTIAERIGHRWAERVWRGRLAVAHLVLGQPEKAIELLEATLSTTRQIGDRRTEGFCLGHLGDAYRDKGQFEQAIEFYEEALDINQKIGHRRRESHQLLGLGRVFLVTEKIDKAQQHCEEALLLRVPETDYLAELALGVTHLHQHHPVAGDTFVKAVVRCWDVLDRTAGLYRTRYALAAALEGVAVCDPHWKKADKRARLLAPALKEYQRALENCDAPGVVGDAIRDLELIRAAGIDGLEPIFELLQSALADSESKWATITAASDE
jgi:tetratricopeptide (TPR) repeat protein